MTVGVDPGHTDVGLWFLLSLRRDEGLRIDRAEFRTVRWWSADEIGGAGPAAFDQALCRFITKLAARPDGALREG